jgi:hypothetical protein
MSLRGVGFVLGLFYSLCLFANNQTADFVNKVLQRQAFLENMTESQIQSSFDYSTHLNDLEIDFEKQKYSFELHNVPVWGWDVGPYSLQTDLDIKQNKVYKNLLGVDVYLKEEDKTKRYQIIRENSALILAGLNISDMGWLHFVSATGLLSIGKNDYAISLIKIMSASDMLDTQLRLTNVSTGEESLSFYQDGKTYLRVNDIVYEIGELARLQGLLKFIGSQDVPIFSPVLNRYQSFRLTSLSPSITKKYRWKFPFEKFLEKFSH